LNQDDIYVVDNDKDILDSFTGKTVLVVDDDMITQLTTKALLGSCNFDVVLSHNGNELLIQTSI